MKGLGAARREAVAAALGLLGAGFLTAEAAGGAPAPGYRIGGERAEGRPHSPAAESMPDLLFGGVGMEGKPLFVAADRAFDPNGELVEEYFFDYAARAIQSGLEHAERIADCSIDHAIEESWMDPPNRDSLAATLASSELVLVAEVSGRAYGFADVYKGQLLRFEVLRWLKGTQSLRTLFGFVPVGRFSAGPYEICATDGRQPRPPEIGERVLLMIPDDRNRRDEHVDLISYGNSLVVLGDDRRPRYPTEWKERNPKRVRKLLRRVEVLLREQRSVKALPKAPS